MRRIQKLVWLLALLGAMKTIDVFEVKVGNIHIKIERNLSVEFEPLPFLDDWVKALRSGEYKQNTEGLLGIQTPEDEHPRYCCLGVLIERCGSQSDWINLSPGHSKLNELGSYGPDGSRSSAFVKDPDIFKRIGGNGLIPDYCKGLFDGLCSICSLAQLNDMGVSFPVIADIIEFVWGDKSRRAKSKAISLDDVSDIEPSIPSPDDLGLPGL